MKPRGFAVMSTEQKRRISSLGGKALVRKYGRHYMKELGSIGGSTACTRQIKRRVKG